MQCSTRNQIIDTVKNCDKLSQLKVRGCGISETGIEALQTSFNGVLICNSGEVECREIVSDDIPQTPNADLSNPTSVTNVAPSILDRGCVVS